MRANYVTLNDIHLVRVGASWDSFPIIYKAYGHIPKIFVVVYDAAQLEKVIVSVSKNDKSSTQKIKIYMEMMRVHLRYLGHVTCARIAKMKKSFFIDEIALYCIVAV